MNLLGKIFVVLILVMSILFLGFSVAVYATHKNWRATIERSAQDVKPGEPLGLKFQLQEAKAKVTNLEAQLSKLQQAVQTEDQSRRAQLAKLETDAAELRKEYNRLVEEQAKLRQGQREAVEAAKTAQDLLDEKLKEVDDLRTEIATAHEDRDRHFKEVVALTDKLHESEGERFRLTANHETLSRLVAQYREAADRLGVDIHQPVDNIPPKLDGIVLASSNKGLVEVSLGGDDGLRRGHQAYVYRQTNGQSKPIAKIDIIEVRPDKAVGKVIPETRMAPVRKEDRVTTRFN